MTKRARSGRGWDAAPPRAPRTRTHSEAEAGRVEWFPGEGEGEPPAAPGRRRARHAGDGDTPTGASRTPEDPHQQARDICLRLLSVRPRTRKELADGLRKKEVAEDVIAEVLDRYDEVGIIDDGAFARAWVESRHHGRGLARRALSQELRRKGVDSEVVEEALAELAPEDEESTARELVERKVRTMRGEPDAVLRRLVGMLARKGYGPGVAYRIVKDVLDQRGLDGDGEAWADALEAEAAEAEWERPDRV